MASSRSASSRRTKSTKSTKATDVSSATKPSSAPIQDKGAGWTSMSKSLTTLSCPFLPACLDLLDLNVRLLACLVFGLLVSLCVLNKLSAFLAGQNMRGNTTKVVYLGLKLFELCLFLGSVRLNLLLASSRASFTLAASRPLASLRASRPASAHRAGLVRSKTEHPTALPSNAQPRKKHGSAEARTRQGASRRPAGSTTRASTSTGSGAPQPSSTGGYDGK
jgi:hypothetical protein